MHRQERQRVGRDFLFEAQLLDDTFDTTLHRGGVHRSSCRRTTLLVSSDCRKEKGRITMRRPVTSQDSQRTVGILNWDDRSVVLQGRRVMAN